jgi:hypothetical protein
VAIDAGLSFPNFGDPIGALFAESSADVIPIRAQHWDKV